MKTPVVRKEGAQDPACDYQDGQPVAPFDLDAMPGTGDIWSTAADVTRFTAALHRGELVAESSLRAMRTAQGGLTADPTARLPCRRRRPGAG